MSAPPPLVWLPADHRHMDGSDNVLPAIHLGHKYAYAVTGGASAQPVMFPLAQPEHIGHWLSLVDGVLLTGSPSNVHPSHFGQSVADATLPLDPERDAITLALVRECVAHGLPLLGICRGFQEINVALGGSLHQQVHAVPGLTDHREDDALSLREQYELAHEVHIQAGSVFEQWAGGTSARVNSLHGQGIDRLAKGLKPMATAPDGLVEAYAIDGAPAFAYAVQWHPEWQFWSHPFYAAILAAFGRACADHQHQRLAGSRQKAVPMID